MKMTTFLTPVLVATGLLCASAFPAAAQAPGGRGMGGGLTQDQRTKMREVMQASQSELTQLNEKLAAAQKEALRAALAERTGKKIELEEQVDPSLLGGMVVKVGSTVYDGSVRTQIQKIRENLKKG